MKDAELRETVSRMAASLYALEELLPPEIVQKWNLRQRVQRVLAGPVLLPKVVPLGRVVGLA